MQFNYFFQLPNVPTIGYTAPLLTYLSAMKYIIKGREMIQEGYNKVCILHFPLAQNDT